jgi:hypothetical protein
VLGDPLPSGDVYRVAVLAGGVVPDYAEGDIVYVTGTSVQGLIDGGKLELREVLYGAALTRGRLYCVVTDDNTVCYTSLSLARDHIVQNGGALQVRNG